MDVRELPFGYFSMHSSHPWLSPFGRLRRAKLFQQFCGEAKKRKVTRQLAKSNNIYINSLGVKIVYVALMIGILLIFGYVIFHGKEEARNTEVDIFDAMLSYVGVHIIDANTNQHDYYEKLPTDGELTELLHSLNLEGVEHFITIVPKQGESLCVHGKFDDEDGMEADYSSPEIDGYKSAKNPLKTKKDIEKLISLYIKQDKVWIDLYRFE